MNIMSYRSQLPYPPIMPAQPNQDLARMILDNVGGVNSEMSAVSLYLYDSLILQEQQPQISQVFRSINIVEMHHLELFGTLAHKLGANPRLWACAGRRAVYWSPRYNNYPVELCALLRNALDGERAAIEKYEAQAQKACDPNVSDLLTRIAADEKIHVNIYQQLLEEYCGDACAK